MAFSADEVRVLRRALAEVLHPAGRAGPPDVPRPARYVQDYLRLAQAVDEAAGEAGRLRAFLLADLDRYRQALPGSAGGYLQRLSAALDCGHVPGPDDLAALRRLRALPCGAPEHLRRTAILRRCETLAENHVRTRLEAHMPAPRRLLTLPGLADEPAPEPKPKPKPAPKPGPVPASPEPGDKPAPDAPDEPAAPRRRTPTPAEIWPPHRRDRRPGESARSA